MENGWEKMKGREGIEKKNEKKERRVTEEMNTRKRKRKRNGRE